MKRFFVVFCGVYLCDLSIGLESCGITFVNDSKSVYTIDASELKDAILSCNHCSAIDRIQIHPGRYLYTYLHNKNTHIDHGCINIRRDETVVSVINIKIPEHFTSWKLILDNENWWSRFSVNEPMKTVIEKQIWYHVAHFIKIHDYNPEYRYSNQPEYPPLWNILFDGSENPELPTYGDSRPQVVAPVMDYPIIRENYSEEKYKSEEGGCCLLQ